MYVSSTLQPMRREPRSADEVDAFGPGRKALKSMSRPGRTADIKRRCRKRERHETRTGLRTGRY